jgi:hypothetical protein
MASIIILIDRDKAGHSGTMSRLVSDMKAGQTGHIPIGMSLMSRPVPVSNREASR